MSKEMFFFFGQIKVAILQNTHEAILKIDGTVQNNSLEEKRFSKFMDHVVHNNEHFLFDLRGLEEFSSSLKEILKRLQKCHKHVKFLTNGGAIESQIRSMGIQPTFYN